MIAEKLFFWGTWSQAASIAADQHQPYRSQHAISSARCSSSSVFAFGAHLIALGAQPIS